MKKQWISALLVLLLMLLIPVTASADVIYPAPGEFTVGEEVYHLLATLDPGGTVWTDESLLPDGLYVLTVDTEEGVNVYLCGVPTTPGTYTLFFNYNGNESLCSITIVEAEIPEPVPVSVSVETLPEQTQYTAGDVLQPEGLILRVELSDGGSFLVTEGFALYPTRLEEAGTRSIEVNYEGLLCYFDVEVAPAPELIEGIGVLTLPGKVIYDVGEELDPSGLSIRVYTNNGTRDEFTELLCSPTQLTTPGEQLITVSYREFTCTFTVHVLEEEAPASIAVYRLPNKLDYNVGEELDASGLVLIETSNRDNPSLLEEGYSCEPTQLEEAGQQEITVSVGELQCSYYVTVRAGAPAASDPTAAPEPERQAPAAPTTVVVLPEPELIPERGPAEETHSGKLLAAVIVVAALAALLILTGYVLMIKRGEKEYFADSVKELFRRRR